MNILKTFLRLEVFRDRDVPKMSKNIERLLIQAKSFENSYGSAFSVNLQAADLQLCRKIKSTTNIFSIDLSTF